MEKHIYISGLISFIIQLITIIIDTYALNLPIHPKLKWVFGLSEWHAEKIKQIADIINIFNRMKVESIARGVI